MTWNLILTVVLLVAILIAARAKKHLNLRIEKIRKEQEKKWTYGILMKVTFNGEDCWRIFDKCDSILLSIPGGIAFGEETRLYHGWAPNNPVDAADEIRKLGWELVSRWSETLLLIRQPVN